MVSRNPRRETRLDIATDGTPLPRDLFGRVEAKKLARISKRWPSNLSFSMITSRSYKQCRDYFAWFSKLDEINFVVASTPNQRDVNLVQFVLNHYPLSCCQQYIFRYTKGRLNCWLISFDIYLGVLWSNDRREEAGRGGFAKGWATGYYVNENNNCKIQGDRGEASFSVYRPVDGFYNRSLKWIGASFPLSSSAVALLHRWI